MINTNHLEKHYASLISEKYQKKYRIVNTRKRLIKKLKTGLKMCETRKTSNKL